MTTVKEFENRKKDIQIEISEMIVMPMQSFTSLQELDDSLRSYQQGIIQQLKQLQPPRPTCSTCNHSVKIYDAFESKIIARECKKVSLFKSSTGNAVELPIKNWGCTKHSDYEVTNE